MAEQQLSARKELSQQIARRIDGASVLCERHNLSTDIYKRIAIHAIINTPALLSCDRASVMYSLMKALEAGLIPDGNQAAIVPFKGRATLIPMIDGKLMLARRAVPGIRFDSAVVYDGDSFDCERGVHPHLRHTPSLSSRRRPQDVQGAYALAFWPDDVVTFEVLTQEELLRYKARSPSARSKGKTPWETDYAEMCKKDRARSALEANAEAAIRDASRPIHRSDRNRGRGSTRESRRYA